VSKFTDTIGLNPDALVDQIVNKGISVHDATRLVNNLIAVNLGQAGRHFAFSNPLPTTDPASCPPQFARTFAHQDWVDGESVVQASESADDKGFNWRLNAIATDLDALARDTKDLYACLVTLRTELVAALQDVAAELNRLDVDVAGTAVRLPPFTPWNVNIQDAPQFLGVRELDGGKVTMWKTGQGVMVLPGVDTVGLQDTVNQRLGTGGLIIRAAAENQAFATDLGSGMKASDLVAKYGGLPLGDGRTIGQALSILPPDTTFQSTQAAVDAVNTQEQAFLHSTIGAVTAINTVTGVTSEGQPLTQVSTGVIAGSVVGAPSNLPQGLSQAGIASVGDLAGIKAGDLVTRLQQHGVTISEAQAAEITTRASMIAGLGAKRIGG